jgi:hypothetical protein
LEVDESRLMRETPPQKHREAVSIGSKPRVEKVDARE